MTAEEVKTVSDLQQRGLGYKKIASLTGISVNTAKAYFHRHKVLREETGADGTRCRNCGRALEIISGRKRRMFCSDACRLRWWNTHPGEVKRKAYYSFICPQCGKSFESYGNNHRTFCSRSCAGQSRRKEVVTGGC